MLVAAVVAAALFLPDLLDTPVVRAEIQRRLATVIRGELAWEDLSVRILPRPHGSLRNFRVERPGVGTISAEALYVQLRLKPLLHGRAEIASLTVVKPVISIGIVPAPAGKELAKDTQPAQDIVELYRSTAGAVVDVAARFAPDTLLTVNDATIDVRFAGVPPIQLSNLSLQASTASNRLDIGVTTASNYFSRLTLSAHLDPGNLSGAAHLDVVNIEPAAWLERYLADLPVRIAVPGASVRARARTDGKTGFESDLDLRAEAVAIARGRERIEVPAVELRTRIIAGAQEIAVHIGESRLGASRLAGGELRYFTKDGSLAGDVGFSIDLAQGMDYTRRLLAKEAGEALESFRSVAGRAHGRVELGFGRGDWRVGVHVEKSDAALQILDLPGPVQFTGGAVEVDPHAVTAHGAAVSMPAGKINITKLRYSLRDGAASGGAEFDLDLPNTLEFVRHVLPEKDRDALSVIESSAGRMRGTAKLAYTKKDWSAAVEIAKSDAQVQVHNLPGPAGIAAGAVHVTPAAVKVDRASLTLLDAAATASATIGDFSEGPRVQGSIAEGTLGSKFLDWVWQVAKAPPHLMLKSPVQVTVPNFVWGPKQALEVQATARFDAGQNLAVDLGWTPAAFEVRRAALKDTRTDAVVAVRSVGRLLEGRFSGSLQSASITAMLRSEQVPSGSARGDFRFTVDPENPRNTSAEGRLTGTALDLAWLIRRPVRIERIDLSVDGDTLRIGEATVDWAGQRATLRGEVKRGEGPPIVNAQIESPGVVVDKLRGTGDVATGKKPAGKDAPPKPAQKEIDEPSRIWPLPIMGRIEVRSDFVQSGRYKVAPVAATLVLEERQAQVDLTQAGLCGISLPLTFKATPHEYSVSANIAAEKQQLEQTANCLSGEGVLISGLFDLKADVSTQGKPEDLLKNLKGAIRADMRDGKVMKFALLGNILSMGNVAALMKEGGPKLDERGFPYRNLVVSGRFEDGRLLIDEGAFRSDALGLATTGWISLIDYSSQLMVLVAPFSRLDQLVRDVPLFGYIIGGTFTSVPVGVSGDIRNPLVVPLGPRAVTSDVLGIFERTLKLPAKLVTPEDQRKAP